MDRSPSDTLTLWHTMHSLPFPIQTPLEPGESLESLFERLAQIMHYGSAATVVAGCRELLRQRRVHDDSTFPTHEETFELLAELTGIDPTTLHAATPHSFASILTPPSTSIHQLHLRSGISLPLLSPSLLREHLPLKHGMKFCPNCLREASYHRLAWRLRPVAACLRHKQLLINTCATCTQPMSIQSIVEARCRYCGADLRTMTSAAIEENSPGWIGQYVIQRWFAGTLAPDDGWTACLPISSPRILYCLLEWLIFVLSRIKPLPMGADIMKGYLSVEPEPKNISKHLAVPSSSYNIYTIAFSGIFDWPNGLHSLTSKFRRLDTIDLFFRGYFHPRWKDSIDFPEMNFLKEFLQDIADNYYIQSHPRLSIQEAADILSISSREIYRLVDNRTLSSYLCAEPDRDQSIDTSLFRSFRPPYPFVDTAEVLRLRCTWVEYISLDEAANWLGLSTRIVMDLVDRGLIAADYQAQVDGSRYPIFSRDSVSMCLENVEGRIWGAWNDSNCYVDLTTAVNTLTPYCSTEADVLKAIIDGYLRSYYRSGNTKGLGGLCFLDEDIQRCKEVLARQQRWSHEDHDLQADCYRYLLDVSRMG